jgi:hypothetical protein
MRNYFDLRTELTYEIRARINRSLSNRELNEVIDALISVRDELDYTMLRSIGIIVLNDGNALLRAELEVLNHILSRMRQATGASAGMRRAI